MDTSFLVEFPLLYKFVHTIKFPQEIQIKSPEKY